MKQQISIFFIFLALVHTVAEASRADDSDPWWNQSSESLPHLIAEGWRIVGFSVNDGKDSRVYDYILQHPDRQGAYWCNTFSTVLPDSSKKIIASCHTIRKPE